MVLYGPILSSMVLYGPICFCRVLCGPVWSIFSHMVPVGPVSSHIVAMLFRIVISMITASLRVGCLSPSTDVGLVGHILNKHTENK